MTDIKVFGEQVLTNLEKVVIGKRQSIELIVVGLLCQGHVLIEDVPGVGKRSWHVVWRAHWIVRLVAFNLRRICFPVM